TEPFPCTTRHAFYFSFKRQFSCAMPVQVSIRFNAASRFLCELATSPVRLAIVRLIVERDSTEDNLLVPQSNTDKSGTQPRSCMPSERPGPLASGRKRVAVTRGVEL